METIIIDGDNEQESSELFQEMEVDPNLVPKTNLT